VHSLTNPAPGAFGGEMGVYRSPAPLPSGRLIASCDQDAPDLNGTPHYGLCELDPSGNSPPRQLYRDGGSVAVEPAAVYARAATPVFVSRSDEVNGSTSVDEGGGDEATVHYLDVQLLGTLLFANTRTGRPIDKRVTGFEWLQAEPPPADATSFDGLGDVVEDDFGRFYQKLHSLGRARMEVDGSLRVRLPAGVPLSVALIDVDDHGLSFGSDAPLRGPMRQREAMQFYPGEHAKQSMQRTLFNGVCAGCHGSISGRELDVGVNVDVLTSASRTLASDDLVDLR
jgi:hypothetical protein